MKIAIVGDPHISTGFRARVDDYLKTVLGKIVYIAERNDVVIFLGDLFDTSAMTTYVFNETYRALEPYMGKLHTILGNHDMFHRNLKSLNRTTIGSLSLTKIMQVHTKPFKIDKYTFVPVMTDDPVDKIPVAEDNHGRIGLNDKHDHGYSVLLAHKYYEMLVCPEESFDFDDIKNLNYRWVFLGHDHSPYDPELCGNSIIFRPGSLTRTTVDMYNKDRRIRYYQIDTELDDVLVKDVEHKPSAEVYLKGSFDKPAERVIRTDSSSLTKLLARFDKKAINNLSLDGTLKRLGGTPQQVQYLRELHLSHNIQYN